MLLHRKLMGTDIPMGILPLGTFNYVARVLNIPLDLLDAAKAISEGQPRSCTCGTAESTYLFEQCQFRALSFIYTKKRTV